MLHSKIVILHKLPNRMRVFLSHAHLYNDKLKEFVMKDENISSFEYSHISSNLLVTYNPLKIDSARVLGRIIIGFSLEEDSARVKVHDHTVDRNLPLILFSVLFFSLSKGMTEYRKNRLNNTFYLGSLVAMAHSIGKVIVNESTSTIEYTVSSLKNPDSGKEFYHAEITEGGRISRVISIFAGKDGDDKGIFGNQLVFDKQ